MNDRSKIKLKGFKKKYPFDYYLVGGQVRDQLLGIKSQDYDFVVVGQTPEKLTSLGLVQVGKAFPVFIDPQTKDEYALARKEIKVGHGHGDFKFIFDPSVTLAEDLKRRDFTVNAICMDSNGGIIDLYDGLTDLQNKKLKHVSEHFAEDPLRVLRGAKFCARLDFVVAPQTLAIMQEIVEKNQMQFLSRERIKMEFDDALATNLFHKFVSVLRTIKYWDEFSSDFPLINELNSFSDFSFKWIFSGAQSSQGDLEILNAWQEKYLHPTIYVKKAVVLHYILKILKEKNVKWEDALQILNYVQDGKNNSRTIEFFEMLDQLSLLENCNAVKLYFQALFQHFLQLNWPAQLSGAEEALKIKTQWFEKFKSSLY